jgi:hypothetical protein
LFKERFDLALDDPGLFPPPELAGHGIHHGFGFPGQLRKALGHQALRFTRRVTGGQMILMQASRVGKQLE